MITIPPGHKYAALALAIEGLKLTFTEPLELGTGLFVTAKLPVAVPDHWETWLGTIQLEDLRRANLVLVSHAPSTNPTVLDGENEAQILRIRRIYSAFLIAVPYVGHQEGTRLSGVNHDGQVDVKSVSHHDALPSPLGCYGGRVDDAVLQNANVIADAIEAMGREGGHQRTWRVLRAFYAAILALDGGERVHQAVRCIEGFILPDIGSTRRQFIYRGQLFVGPEHETLLGDPFDLRSKVEHLHGAHAAVAADVTEADIWLSELSFKAEALAPACLRRLLMTPALWPHFIDDVALQAFWTLPFDTRRSIWGPPENSAAMFSLFSARTARIQLT